MQPIHQHASFTNEELVSGIAENDRQVLNYIYHKNFPAVKQYVIQNSGEEADARDIFQEAMIATWMNIRDRKFQLVDGTTLDGYLCQIARNKWLDHLRSKSTRHTVRLVNSPADYAIESDNDSHLNEEERIVYLQRLYNSLGLKCQQILKLFYFKKQSLLQISESLNHDPETLRTMKYRCMMKLRKLHGENKDFKHNL